MQPTAPTPVPMPQILDPDRLLTRERDDMTAGEHRSRAKQFEDALNESCEYAQQLWKRLEQTRDYLVRMLPPDPHDPDYSGPYGAAPTGPDDEAGWEAWIDAYSEVTSALAGPHGDSGYGRSEARLVAQFRRDVDPAAGQTPSGDPARETEPVTSASPTSSAHQPEPSPPSGVDADAGPARRLRQAGLAVLTVLALRGLRRRPRSSD
jgi:hypothetical protein